ncbi:MAG: alpha/beta hydrolase [Bacteroidota bacterium]
MPPEKRQAGESIKTRSAVMAPDLRLAGSLARPFFNLLYRRILRKNKKDRTLRSKAKNYPDATTVIAREKRPAFSVYLRRNDQTYLRLWIMRPKGVKGSVPGVLWIHGGGFAIGAPEYSKAPDLAETGRCVIVSPAYIKSVDRPYPAALDDCYQALLWMKENAAALGIGEEQLFIGGESAGGGLAVATCLLARDRKEVNIAFQMPLYPMLDDRMNTGSMTGNRAPVWNEASNAKAWKLYLAGLEDRVIPSYAAPARESDYRGLPPAVSFIGELDPFLDETCSYVARLREQGIPVQFATYAGAYHAFDVLVPRSRTAREAKRFWIESFLRACEENFAPQGVNK